MTRRTLQIVLVALVAIVAYFAIDLDRPQAAYQQDVPVQRWEYRLVSIAEGIREFNRLGADGWEICGVSGQSKAASGAE